MVGVGTCEGVLEVAVEGRDKADNALFEVIQAVFDFVDYRRTHNPHIVTLPQPDDFFLDLRKYLGVITQRKIMAEWVKEIG